MVYTGNAVHWNWEHGRARHVGCSGGAILGATSNYAEELYQVAQYQGVRFSIFAEMREIVICTGCGAQGPEEGPEVL